MGGNFLRRHPLLTGAAVLGLGVSAAGLATDSRLDPVRWRPPDPPTLTGPLEPNQALTATETVCTVDAPEDVAFDDDGRLYTGSSDGVVRRTVDPVDDEATDVALEAHGHTGGQPLALAFAGEDLLVCVAGVGLVAIGPHGNARVLTDWAGGRPIAFADDLHVTDEGTVYFTDATVHDRYRDELVELRDTGRLLAYDPESGETTVETEDFGFANGIAPGPDGDSLLITETSRYRITRYWFRGPRAGEREHVATNLPGFPDNIDAGPSGRYWVAVPALRDSTIDLLHEYPWLGRQLGKLPPAALEAIGMDPYGLVLEMTADGELRDSLHDPTGAVHGITSATLRDGALYLGTLFGDRVLRYSLGED